MVHLLTYLPVTYLLINITKSTTTSRTTTTIRAAGDIYQCVLVRAAERPVVSWLHVVETHPGCELTVVVEGRLM